MTTDRERRLVFGEAAGLYDAARPSYPAALIDDVVGLVGTPARALDVGCGTGKALRLLAARGLGGVGVEAHPAMAEVARASLDPAAAAAWRIDVADFEAWEPGPGDEPFDLVTCAQAWHWLDPAVRMHKAHGLLRPGGWLALWWNTTVADDSPARRALEPVYERLAPGMQNGLLQFSSIDPVVGGSSPVPADLAVGEPITRHHAWSHTYTSRELVDLLSTQSNHRLLPPERREPLLAAVAEAVDGLGGSVEHRYVARLWAIQRTGGTGAGRTGTGGT